MKILKQSTATVLSFGPFVSPADGVTLVTSLVSALDHGTTGIFLSKAGGAGAIRHAAVTATTYDSYGMYLVTLDTTDTNTLGRLRVMFAAAASCLPMWDDFLVVPANIYDSLVAGSDVLDVSVTQLLGTAWLTPGTAGTPDVNAKLLGGTAQTGRDIGASVLLSSGAGAGQLDFTAGVVKSNLAQILGTALTETAGLLAGGFKKFFNIVAPVSTMDVLARVTLTDTVTTYTGNTPQTGDSFARLGAPAGVSIEADIASIKTDTGTTIPGRLPAALTGGKMESNLGSVTAGVIAAASFAATALDAVWSTAARTLTAFGFGVTVTTNNDKTGYGITANVKTNQALAAFEFLMTDSTTHAPKTGLGAAVTVTRSIDGGAFAAGTLSAVAEISNGLYKVDFGAGDLNGKVIVLRATAAASDDTFERLITQP